MPSRGRIYRPAAAREMARDRGQFCRAPLLPVARRPTPFADRIMLALELAGPRAAEVTLSLKVIDQQWGVTSYEPIAGTGHARGRIMAYGLLQKCGVRALSGNGKWPMFERRD